MSVTHLHRAKVLREAALAADLLPGPSGPAAPCSFTL